MHAYGDADGELVDLHGRVHANGEQTFVAVLSCGEKAYVAVAYDVRPHDYTPLAAEIVAHDPTARGASERAEAWMETNPKGVAPGDDSGGSGALETVKKIGKRLNDYGNTLAEQQQQGEQGGKQ